MNIVVCVKQIPDPADPGALDPETKTLKRDVKLILDESDSYGVEMALQLVDEAGEGEVRLVSMAPNNEMSGLRTALAMGAESAVLVSDDSLAGSDALSTAKVSSTIYYFHEISELPNSMAPLEHRGYQRDIYCSHYILPYVDYFAVEFFR